MENKTGHDVDSLLKNALRSSETPDAGLVQKVKYRMKHKSIKEEPVLKKQTIKHSFGVAAVVAAIMLITATAFAAWHFLSPGDVADKTGNTALKAAFYSETAVNINESVTSGGYTFTMLAVVSGKDITDMPYYSADVQDERTYAVVAIQNADGTPFGDYGDAILSAPATDDGSAAGLSKHDEDGTITNLSPIFFASPLVKGLKPWEVNAATMNGGYSEVVADGVLYRVVECDDVTMFADRGLYFGIASTAFISNGTFLYNERTGEITANPDFDGASAVFYLPIDNSLADPEKAAQYLDGLNASVENDGDVETPPGTGNGADTEGIAPLLLPSER
ncbi:MAG: DUF4179 domain-containing protein [Treponema sp.]|jgi:hypothetical protein|nr:DUF4179 domain-containing protein [Treponema sp.]